MVESVSISNQANITYPERDGNPMSDNYIYDPDKIDLQGWLRNNGELTVIEEMKGWISPRLGIKFELTTERLEIFRPDGDKFLTFFELGQLRDTERKRADDEQKRANQLQEKLQQEQEQRRRLEDKLRELGIDINDI